MILTLQRKPQQLHSTPGLLSINGVFECFTLEPLSQGIPFPRIAAVRAPISLRPSQKFQLLAQTDAWWKLFCDVMPHIDYKPDSVTMIHPLNTPDQTHDCVGVGRNRALDFIGESRAAFMSLHPKIEQAVKTEGCWIEIIDCANDAEQVSEATKGEN